MTQNNIRAPLSPKNTICTNKWDWPVFKIQNQTYRLCCLTKAMPMDINLQDTDVPNFMNTQYQIDRRVDMMRGIRDPECNNCWKQEDLGSVSMRTSMMSEERFVKQFENSLLREFGTTDLDEISGKVSADSDIVKFNNPKKVELVLGNQCDLHCVYCNLYNSSQWSLTEYRNKTITYDQYKLVTSSGQSDKAVDAIWKWMDSDVKHTLQYISIVGGEPLIIPEFYNIADKLIKVFENTTNRPQLIIITNLNTPTKYFSKFLTYLEELSRKFNILVSVSIEATHNRAEYIRSNLDWDLFEKNLDTLLSLDSSVCNIQFLPSINILSLSSTREFLEWHFNKCTQFNRDIKLESNIVTKPEFLSPYILSPNFIRYIDSAVAYLRQQTYGTINFDYYCDYLLGIKQALSTNNLIHPQTKKDFLNRIEMFDARSSLKFVDIFPEMQEFFLQCKDDINDVT